MPSPPLETAVTVVLMLSYWYQCIVGCGELLIIHWFVLHWFAIIWLVISWFGHIRFVIICGYWCWW